MTGQPQPAGPGRSTLSHVTVEPWRRARYDTLPAHRADMSLSMRDRIQGRSGEMSSLASEFRAFVLRGNVIDLAVAVVIGAAFGAVVTSLVENIFTPLIAALVGQPDFSGLSFTINNSVFNYGAFLNALFSFLTIALGDLLLRGETDERADGALQAIRGGANADQRLPPLLEQSSGRRHTLRLLHLGPHSVGATGSRGRQQRRLTVVRPMYGHRPLGLGAVASRIADRLGSTPGRGGSGFSRGCTRTKGAQTVSG